MALKIVKLFAEPSVVPRRCALGTKDGAPPAYIAGRSTAGRQCYPSADGLQAGRVVIVCKYCSAIGRTKYILVIPQEFVF